MFEYCVGFITGVITVVGCMWVTDKEKKKAPQVGKPSDAVK